MAALFFGSAVDVDILLEDEDVRKHVDVKMEKERVVSCPVYYDGDTLAGQVCVILSLASGIFNSCIKSRYPYAYETGRSLSMMASKLSLSVALVNNTTTGIVVMFVTMTLLYRAILRQRTSP